MSKDLTKEVRAELKQSGEIVRVDTAAAFQHVSPVASAGFRTVVRQRGVSVEQRKGKTTGLRPDFGRHQLRYLNTSLEQKQGEVVERIGKTLDKLAGANGF